MFGIDSRTFAAGTMEESFSVGQWLPAKRGAATKVSSLGAQAEIPQ